MNFSLISALFVILSGYCTYAKPGLWMELSPYGFNTRMQNSQESSMESYNSNNNQQVENLQESVNVLKGQMVLFTVRGLLQNIAMRGIAEKIDTMDQRLIAIEDKMGLSTSENPIDDLSKKFNIITLEKY